MFNAILNWRHAFGRNLVPTPAFGGDQSPTLAWMEDEGRAPVTRSTGGTGRRSIQLDKGS